MWYNLDFLKFSSILIPLGGGISQCLNVLGQPKLYIVSTTSCHLCAQFQGPITGGGIYTTFRGADIPHGGGRIDMVSSQLCLL